MFDVNRMSAAGSPLRPVDGSSNESDKLCRDSSTLRSTPALPSASFNVATSAVSTPLVAIIEVVFAVPVAVACVVVVVCCRCCICA
jgi:hypothetical protein